MADSALQRKLKLKPGLTAALFGAPEGYAATLQPLPEGTTLVEDPSSTDAQFDWVQLFVRDRAALDATIPAVRRSLKPVSQLWISYPKGSSRIQTDLTRDKGWESIPDQDLLWINLISIDDTWSAFGLRPLKPGEPRQAFR
jgi:hypothetical protein